ncbi:Amino-acid acetyltransferase [Trichoderma ghanense]|uniref:Amino-acid acetyltransferase n=1 Tax=Trichoderma ghanense TaxID=65468 RepID=A0ABY2GPK3_9HYPO
MASTICWSRANINPCSPNHGVLAFRQNLASRCSSALSRTIARNRATIGTLGTTATPPPNGSSSQPAAVRSFSSPTPPRSKRQMFDRLQLLDWCRLALEKQLTPLQDVIVSVLESTATRRDAKGYLQKYALPRPASPVAASKPAEHPHKPHSRQLHTQQPFDVAIVVLRNPQTLRSDTIHGIAKTLTQLRVLGLLSVVVVDCDPGESRFTFQSEALRLCEAVDSFGKPGARLVENVLVGSSHYQGATPSPFWDDIYVHDYGILNRALQHDMITVIPSLALNDETATPAPADAQRTSLALTRYFTGIQFERDTGRSQGRGPGEGTEPLASVERVIILDTYGGTPVPGRPGVCQRFVNLEQEYDTLLDHLGDHRGLQSPETNSSHEEAGRAHAKNLKLAKDTLSLLPEAASVLITTPSAAANTSSTSSPGFSPVRNGDFQLGFDGMVTTRRKQNPLLHNLLTDKPVFSPSLPLQRIQSPESASLATGESIDATLVKRGMPLAIYPDPRTEPWRPPAPGERRLQLTDRSIDLQRLVTLIEDSFGRKLDVDDYLQRTNQNLAGVIIAGEYEGCAILTWEKPNSLDPRTAYEQGRFVPYLDKFAVLRSRQGSGGVADIIFNAMVRDCFPDGVLWRSRKDNPVNKWYFERSVGTSKLAGCNWAMFWTTLELSGKGQKLADYEAVCREIMPSWADSVKGWSDERRYGMTSHSAYAAHSFISSYLIAHNLKSPASWPMINGQIQQKKYAAELFMLSRFSGPRLMMKRKLSAFLREASSTTTMSTARSVQLTQREQQLRLLLVNVAKFIDSTAKLSQPVVLRWAGGWVRDRLLGIESHDIDVAINAMTGQQFAQHLSEYCKQPEAAQTHGFLPGDIGRLHHIASNPDKSKHLETAMVKLFGMDLDFVNLRKETYAEDSRNPQMEFGTAEEDALRRDATINALFYNLHTEEVEDFTGGIRDMEAKIIRTPMEPFQTFMDDPLRVLRLIRFASRLGFAIDAESEKFMSDERVLEALRKKISRERVGVELEKMLKGKTPRVALELLDRLGLYQAIFSDPLQEDVEMPDISRWHVAYTCLDELLRNQEPGSIGQVLVDDADSRYLAWNLAAVSPWIPVEDRSGRKQKANALPPVGVIAREGFKASNKLTTVMAACHKHRAEILALKKAVCESAPTIHERDTVGMAIRKWDAVGGHWKLQVLGVMLVDAIEQLDRFPAEDSKAPILDRDEFLQGWDKFLKHLAELDVFDAPSLKRIIDGRALAKALGIPPGTWMGKALEICMAWQLRNPDEKDPEGAIQAVRDKADELGISPTT